MMDNFDIKNIGMITHYDLDGFGCYEALKSFLGLESIPLEYSYAPESTATFNLAIKLLGYNPNIKTLFITDRDINSYHIKKLRESYPELKIVHIDHHKNSKHFNVENTVGYYGRNPDTDFSKSAAELTVEFCELFLLDYRQIKLSDWYEVIHTMSLVGDWDTFRWKILSDKYRIMQVKGLMAIEKIYGSENVFEKIRSFNNNNSLKSDSEEFIHYSNRVYKEYKNILNKEYEKAMKDKIVYTKEDKKVAIVYNINTLYFSLLANRFFESENSEPILLSIYPSGLISVRGDNVRNRINLQELMYKTPGGGGGHFNAAGGKILEELDKEFISDDRTKEFEFRDEEHKKELTSKLLKFLEENL